jgi:hypothetical protein
VSLPPAQRQWVPPILPRTTMKPEPKKTLSAELAYALLFGTDPVVTPYLWAVEKLQEPLPGAQELRYQGLSYESRVVTSE